MLDTFLAPPQTPDFTSRVTWRIIHGNAGILKIFHWASKYFFMFDNHLRVVFSSWATFWNVFVCSSSLHSFSPASLLIVISFFSFFLNRINPFISPLFFFFLLPPGFRQCHFWPYSKCQCYLLLMAINRSKMFHFERTTKTYLSNLIKIYFIVEIIFSIF